jgi:protein CWC15
LGEIGCQCLKLVRKPGQGGDADHQIRDLRAELLAAEAAHFSKTMGGSSVTKDGDGTVASPSKRQFGGESGDDEEEDINAKRRRILEETRDIDADSETGCDEDSSEDDRSVLQNYCITNTRLT